MRKLIAAINMTLDGFCDHTAVNPDEEVHRHYTGLLRGADAALYGRKTYELMEYWRPIAKNPSGSKAMDEFAVVMDKIPKIVFSRTLKETDWESARIAKRSLEEEVSALKQQPGGDILAGSPSVIISLLNLNLIDEFQLCVHPVIAGSGLPLFKNADVSSSFKLAGTKTFGGGAVVLYYEPKIPG